MNHAQLQEAIYDALNVSAVTSLLSSAHSLTPIYSPEAPQPADAAATDQFPYITFQIISDIGFRDKGNDGSNALVQVNIWFRSHSRISGQAIAKAAYDELHRSALAGLTGHFSTECEDWANDDFGDGKTKRERLEFRILSLVTS